jgi:hypothetical protein
MTLETPYSRRFFADYHPESRAAADAIVPILVDLVHPASVVDVGCGIGTWLEVFRAHGISNVMGVDGSHVRADQLRIPVERFLSHELETCLPVRRRYDLALSVEVAEHLTHTASIDLVRTLCELSDVVVFGAAVPHQGGHRHVNEKWQSEWCRAFADNAYVVVDCVRPGVWTDRKVAYYYAQNTLVYVRSSCLASYPGLAELHRRNPSPILDVIHPRKWQESRSARGMSLRHLLRCLPYATARSAWGLLRSRVLGTS